MYATVGSPKAPGNKRDRDEKAETPTARSFDAPLRPKRQQVARACDSCRMHRIKCDNCVPCKNCVNRGEQCINKSPGERRTLPQAYREIERLKQKVRELEGQLENERGKSSDVSSIVSTQPFALTPPATLDASPTPDTASVPRHAPAVWGGVMTSTGQSPQKTWYGPSSLFYFINRMNIYLSAVFQQLHPDDLIQLKSVAKIFATPDCNPPDDEDKADCRNIDHTVSNESYLTPAQEEFFLNLYWQAYHPVLSILDETEFRRHYRSLATEPGKPRKSSPLVDIVIAVSMQVGMAIAQQSSSRIILSATEVGKDDPSIAGRLYYRRCQRLLYNQQEAPTLMTVQCYLLSATYTCCAAFQNMCHAALSLAVRSAHMIGLHTEPPEDMPAATKELRKRVWWHLFTLETKVCMKLGRPFYADAETTSCDLPAHDHQAASLSGSDFALLDENTTWLTYSLFNTTLLLSARETYTAFFDKYPAFYNGHTGQVIYDDLAAMERYAEFLAVAMKPLDNWTKSVPDSLKLKREGDGQFLSTDRSPIVIEQFVPHWLQRQRLLLELIYHVLRLNLYRPFICFPSMVTESFPLGDICLAHATSAAEHSVAATRIFHQAVKNTDLLTGYHEAFQWQWHAALTLAGYLFAYPTSDIAVHVRKAIDLSIIVFEEFGRSFATSLGAALVMRDLAIKIDFLADLVRGTNPPATTVPSAPTAPEQLSAAAEIVPSTNEMPFTQDLFADTIDMAYSVDNSADFDVLWPPLSNDQWWFPPQPPPSFN
ncbi:hypothetical protein F4808DRAFT_417208 [Astrocystis sublimbata]|nr:hypothetical protein F4808DRAFT_417208 [Astrocystis sublimbata]